MKSRFSIWASRGGTVYIPRGVRYGTVRGYVLLGMGTVCRYVLLGTVRYGYGTWVRYVGTVRGYGPWVRRTGTVYPPYLFSENVVLFPKCGANSSKTESGHQIMNLAAIPGFVKSGTRNVRPDSNQVLQFSSISLKLTEVSVYTQQIS